MINFNKRLAITCFTALFSTCPTLGTYAQQINSYEDFKFYCSKEARYYNVQSPDCDRYTQERREVSRPAFTQVTDNKAGNNCMQLALFLREHPQAQSQYSAQVQQCMQSMMLAPAGLSQKAKLLSGTNIELELATRLSSKTAKEGDRVVYFVNEDVVSPNGELLIKKGTRATGQVNEAKRARMLGKKGKLEFTVEEVEAVDGTTVRLRSTVEREGKSRAGTMIAVTALVSVFGVFIKGKNVTVEQGTIVNAYVDNDTLVEVRHP